VFTLREALKELGLKPEATTPACRASATWPATRSSSTSAWAARSGRGLLDQGDQASYTYRKKGGVDLEELVGITDRFGGIDKNKAKDLGYEQLPGDAWLEQEVDILIPRRWKTRSMRAMWSGCRGN